MDGKSKGPSTAWYFVGTFAYLIVVFGFAWYRGFFDPKGVPLEPQEWGDVLAGVFSPLAFLWLLYASLSQRAELELQREELKQNNKTQDKQQKEMSRQASALDAQLARNEADADARYEPLLVVRNKVELANNDPQVMLSNIGANIVNVIFDGEVVAEPATGAAVGSGKKRVIAHWLTDDGIWCVLPFYMANADEFKFSISFQRIDYREETHWYKLVDSMSRLILTHRQYAQNEEPPSPE